jgi:hypothetical protein
VPPLGGGAREGEAFRKGSGDAAALDIVSCPLEGALVASYLVILCNSNQEEYGKLRYASAQ